VHLHPANLLSFSAALLLLGLTSCSTPSASINRPPVPAPARIPAPTQPEELAYLGLPEGTTDFSLDDVQSEVLIIDCFDMYCHACQSGAKRVHAIYHLVQERKLNDRIRFVGLGVGNTPLETASFKRKLNVPFPAFPDRSNAIARQFGTVRLPSLIVLRRESDAWRLIQHHTGIPTNAEEFLSHLLEDLNAASRAVRDNGLHAGLPTCESDACPVPIQAADTPESHSL